LLLEPLDFVSIHGTSYILGKVDGETEHGYRAIPTTTKPTTATTAVSATATIEEEVMDLAVDCLG